MKTRFFLLTILGLGLIMSSCEKKGAVQDLENRYDERIKELEERLAAAEGRVQAQVDADRAAAEADSLAKLVDPYVSGAINGHNYVDLGLPSGRLWASCNLGADAMEKAGDYFAWGETVTKVGATSPRNSYDQTRYAHWHNSYMIKYTSWSDHGHVDNPDNLTVLQAADDAATAQWGAGWRMPDIEDFQELDENCTSTLVRLPGGVSGRLFTAANGNQLYLPEAGYYEGTGLEEASLAYYWTRQLDEKDEKCLKAQAFVMGYDMVVFNMSQNRWLGLTIRPVADPQ